MRATSQNIRECSAVTADSPVIGLFLFRGPANVARFVVTVVITSIQTMLRTRTTPYGLQKFRKRFETKLNTAPAISFKIVCSRVRATLLSIRVGRVFRGYSVIGCIAVNSFYLGVNFLAKAAARFGVSITQITRGDFCGISTVTNALPATDTISIRMVADGQTDNAQESKFLIDQIQFHTFILSQMEVNKPGLLLKECESWETS